MCLVLIAHTPIVRDALNYLIDKSREANAIRVGMSHNEFLDTREVMFYDERDLSVEMIEQEYRDKKFYRDKIADAQPVIQQLTNNGILKGIKPVFLEGTRRYDHSGLFYLVDYEPFHPARPNVWGYFTLDDLIKVAWGLPID